MKILLVNPNTTAAVTDRVRQAAQAAARPGTELLAVTGRFGPEVIGSRAEDALAAHGVLDLVARHAPGCDAVVLAVSLDTALWACRELLDIPVVGMTEAGLLTAALLAPRFGLLTIGPRLVPVYRERVEHHGLLGRLAALAAADLTPQQTLADPEAALARLHDAVMLQVGQGAEAVLLAGAALSTLVPLLQARVPVPLLDGVACAVGLAETLAHQRWPKARTGSVSATGGRPVQGVDPVLQALFAGRR
jgi:allantoin racemase